MPAAFPKKPSSPTSAVAVEYVDKTLAVKSYVPEIIKGLAVSMKHFFVNTRDVVKNQRPDPVIFILWGAPSRKKKALITEPRHFVLESAHPSPLSAHPQLQP